MAVARGALFEMKDRHAKKFSDAILSCTAGFTPASSSGSQRSSA